MLSSSIHFTLNLISSFPFLFTFIQPYHLQWKYITDEVEHPEARNKGERLENFDWGHLVRTRSKNLCSGKYLQRILYLLLCLPTQPLFLPPFFFFFLKCKEEVYALFFLIFAHVVDFHVCQK